MLLPLPWQRRLQGVEGRWAGAATQPGCQVFWRLSAPHPFLPYPFQLPLRTKPLLLSVNHTSTAPPMENLTAKTPQVEDQASWQSEPSNLGLMLLSSVSVCPRGHRVNMNSMLLQSEARVCMATPQKRHHSFPLDLRPQGCPAELAGPSCRDVFWKVVPSWRKTGASHQRNHGISWIQLSLKQPCVWTSH